MITGDFNIHVDVADDPDSIKLLDLLESVGLRQHVTQPTHVHGHTLDLLITRWSDQIIKDPPYVDRVISDHVSLLCKLHPVKPAMTIKKVTYRKLKSVDLQSLNRDLATSALCNDPPRDQADLGPLELDAPVRSYNTTLSKATDRHAPLKTKTMAVRPAVPWYNNKINTAKACEERLNGSGGKQNCCPT